MQESPSVQIRGSDLKWDSSSANHWILDLTSHEILKLNLDLPTFAPLMSASRHMSQAEAIIKTIKYGRRPQVN